MLSLTKSLRQSMLVLSVFTFCCVLQAQGQAQPAPAQTATESSILFTVVDQDRHSFDRLKMEDIRVFEGDRELSYPQLSLPLPK